MKKLIIVWLLLTCLASSVPGFEVTVDVLGDLPSGLTQTGQGALVLSDKGQTDFELEMTLGSAKNSYAVLVPDTLPGEDWVSAYVMYQTASGQELPFYAVQKTVTSLRQMPTMTIQRLPVLEKRPRLMTTQTHLIFRPVGDKIEVQEIYTLANLGDGVFLPDTEVWFRPLASGAVVEPLSGVDKDGLVQEGGKFYFRRPLYPGDNQFALRSVITPDPDKTYSVWYPFMVKELLIAIDATKYHIKSDELEFAGIQSIDDGKWAIYRRTPIPPKVPTSFKLHLGPVQGEGSEGMASASSGAAGSVSPSARMANNMARGRGDGMSRMGTFFLGFCVGAMVMLLLAWLKVRRLVHVYQNLGDFVLDEIAYLDIANDSGTVTKEFYQATRKRWLEPVRDRDGG